MPVVVVLADADQRDPRPRGLVERRLLVAAAVVCDLHDVIAAVQSSAREQHSLRRSRQIPEQQGARHAAAGDLDDDARIVATELGQRYLNDVIGLFLPDGPEERTR